MPHIDYDTISTLDALIDVSDAGARASMLRLREELQRIEPDLDQRVVFDGQHRKPVIAFYRGDDAVLHVYPEPSSTGTGLHVAMPIRTEERRMIALRGLVGWVQEAVVRARPRHNMVWVEVVLHQPSRVDELVAFLQRRLDLLPRVH